MEAKKSNHDTERKNTCPSSLTRVLPVPAGRTGSRWTAPAPAAECSAPAAGHVDALASRCSEGVPVRQWPKQRRAALPAVLLSSRFVRENLASINIHCMKQTRRWQPEGGNCPHLQVLHPLLAQLPRRQHCFIEHQRGAVHSLRHKWHSIRNDSNCNHDMTCVIRNTTRVLYASCSQRRATACERGYPLSTCHFPMMHHTMSPMTNLKQPGKHENIYLNPAQIHANWLPAAPRGSGAPWRCPSPARTARRSARLRSAAGT